MVLLGTTSLLISPAIWYSAGQPLWAGFAILVTLWYAQSYRRWGRWPGLVFAALSAAIAGGFWAAGHLAGPVAAVYLWIDGRRASRRAALVPLAATALAAAASVAMAARPMDSTVSFHGRTIREAVNPIQGAISTAQSIPEHLVFGNLGLDVETTPIQGIVLTLGVMVLWCFGRRRARQQAGGPRLETHDKAEPRWHWPALDCNPLECAGGALVLGSYLLEWSFRGYLEYHNLRTLNLRAVVPWYDGIPQIGAVLFAAGWLSGPRRTKSEPFRAPASASLSWRAALGPVILAAALVTLNRPRVDFLVIKSTPPLLPSEQEIFKITRLQTIRSNAVLSNEASWQRTYLRRLDAGEQRARSMGLGREEIRAAFGHIFIPGATGRLPPPSQFDLYDVAGLLDLPRRGRPAGAAAIRAALSQYLEVPPEPRPDWLAPGEPWPPD
jgi:hypothetical protein